MVNRIFFIIISLLFAVSASGAAAPEIEDQTREIATELRCVVCQNLSVADSPSEMAQQMRAIIREQLAAGKSAQEVKDYFVSKYGEWVLLAPTTKGFSLLVWIVPFIALSIGLALGIFFVRRWTRRKSMAETKAVDPSLLARVRHEAARNDIARLDLEDSSPRSQLLQERAHLFADLKEIEFDYQAGKLSEADYTELRGAIETRAATVLQELDRIADAAPAPRPAKSPPSATKNTLTHSSERKRFRGWQVAVGGSLLLILGVTLGVILTQSIRPRVSEQDSITGDFLTGTGQTRSNETGIWLREGKTAFEKQEWPKAIEAFKKVLGADPNQPDAHAYMGFILLQANHADGALMAFDKALTQAPNFPMALWGKAMTLYQGKQDYAGARGVLEKLLQLMPPGDERNEVARVLAELPQPGQKPQQPAQKDSEAEASSGRINGKITIDPKLEAKLDNPAALFIIARPAGAGGAPPLAVKKIDRPVFPLSYSLGAENVMIQGQPFSGKVSITVRLDKDGNAMTKEPGNLSGEYKKNPVEVGSKNVDIVIDQVTR